jgi:K+-transporting ATPase ATPase C chain
MSFLPAAVRNHLVAFRMLLAFTLITGIVYPLAVTGVAQAAFSHRANGSLVDRNGHVVGSSLIGQNFTVVKNGKDTGKPDAKWFQPRPSAGDYDPTVSGASNLGPNDPGLIKTIKERRAAIAAGSGLDPDISTAYAYEQVNRVANARGLGPAAIRRLVADGTHGRSLGFLGQEYVNVVELNLALSRLG